MTEWKETKYRIMTAESIADADKVIEERTGFKTLEQKVAFITGMFAARVVGKKLKDYDAADYEVLLSTIIDPGFD